MNQAEPFLKWAGGKRILLEQILPLIPKMATEARYFEPFLGGGAVFFALKPVKARLGDANAELIATYRSVRDNVEGVIDRLRKLDYSESSYYKVRSSSPSSSAGKAARFVYLNKSCFNGLYRVNSKGEFNVPFGRHGSEPLLCDREQLRKSSAALKGVSLKAGDFETLVSSAEPGDVVYFDPPYIVSHTNNGFIEYNKQVFAWEDQVRLATLAAELISREIKVIVTNADHKSIQSLYPKRLFRSTRVHRWSTMAGSKQHRFSTTELVFVAKTWG